VALPQTSISTLALVLALGSFSPALVAQPDAQAAAMEPAAPPTALNFEDRVKRELGVPGGLTAEDVATRATATSWSLEARRAELRAAAANADRATWSYLPRVTVTARYTRLSEVDDGGSALNLVAAPGVAPGATPAPDQLVSVPVSFESLLNQYLLQASIVVPVTDYFLRVAPNRASSVSLERAAAENLAAAEHGAAADAKLLYYRWVQARLNTIVAEQAFEQARAQRGDVEQAVAAGTASRADLLGMEARVAESERSLESFRHLTTQLEEELRIARHDPDGTSYGIGEDVASDSGGAELAEEPRQLFSYALSHRPELKALALRAQGAESSASGERAAYLPRFELFGNAQYENPSSRVFPQQDEFVATWNAGAQLAWTLSDIPGAAAATRSARATAAALRAEHKALEDRVRGEISAALRSLRDARSALRTRERELAAAEESYRVRRLLYQNGRATTVELMNAELALTEARFGSIATRLELRVARVRIDYALGRRASGSKRG